MRRGSLVKILVVFSIGLLMLPSVAVFVSSSSNPSGPSTLQSTTVISAPPTGAKGADDITMMANPALNGGKPLLWVAYQNGILPNGTAGKPGGPVQSWVAGFDPSTGALVRGVTIPVTGKIDGLTADPDIGMLIATVNEDAHSALKLIEPYTGTVTSYIFSPDPEVSGNGGTDSIAVLSGHIYVAHSNPNDTAQPTNYEVALDNSTLTAKLTPVFYDNSAATDIVTGASVKLSLTDPDTNFFMPPGNYSFAGALATIGQGDGKIVFASHLPGPPSLSVMNVTDNKPGNVPPFDGLAVATSDRGTLYVVDRGAGTILALNTAGWPAGTVFIGEANDNNNPLVGTLDLSTGKVTPLGNTFVSPKGLLFVPGQFQVVSTLSTTVTSATASSSTAQSTFTAPAATATSSSTSSSSTPDYTLYGGIAVVIAVVVGVVAFAARRRK